MITFWLGLLSPALVLSWANIGKSIPGLLFTILVLLGTAILLALLLGRNAVKAHFLKFFGVEFVVAVLIWLMFFTAALGRLAYEKWNDAEIRAAKLGAHAVELTKKNTELQAQVDDKKHTLQVLEAFRTY